MKNTATDDARSWREQFILVVSEISPVTTGHVDAIGISNSLGEKLPIIGGANQQSTLCKLDRPVITPRQATVLNLSRS
jgi:hypothetical protein